MAGGDVWKGVRATRITDDNVFPHLIDDVLRRTKDISFIRRRQDYGGSKPDSALPTVLSGPVSAYSRYGY